MNGAVEAVLRAGGWTPGLRDDTQARSWALDLAGYATPDGRTHVVVGPALDVFATFGGVTVPPADEGRQIAPAGFRLDPTAVIASVSTLASFGAQLGTDLTPIGVDGDGVGVLAIDRDGRVFVLDHAGEWFLGDTVEEALTALVLGTLPRRVRHDGTW